MAFWNIVLQGRKALCCKHIIIIMMTPMRSLEYDTVSVLHGCYLRPQARDGVGLRVSLQVKVLVNLEALFSHACVFVLHKIAFTLKSSALVPVGLHRKDQLIPLSISHPCSSVVLFHATHICAKQNHSLCG